MGLIKLLNHQVNHEGVTSVWHGQWANIISDIPRERGGGNSLPPLSGILITSPALLQLFTPSFADSGRVCLCIFYHGALLMWRESVVIERQGYNVLDEKQSQSYYAKLINIWILYIDTSTTTDILTDYITNATYVTKRYYPRKNLVKGLTTATQSAAESNLLPGLL